MNESPKSHVYDTEALHAVESLLQTVGRCMKDFNALPLEERERIIRERNEVGRAITRCMLHGPRVIPKVDRDGRIID